LQNVELLIEKTVIGDQEEESTLSKIGNTISNLFKGPEEVLKEEKPVHETPEESPIPQSSNSTLNSTSTFDTINNTEQVTGNNTAPLVVDQQKNLKVVTVKETINVNHEHLFVLPVQENDLHISINKIKGLKEIDLIKSRKETSLNNLETAIIETRDKLDQSDYASAATILESQSILDKCSEISNWLEDDGFDAEADVLDSKLDDLRKIVTPVWERTFEHKERPSRLEALNNAINSSSSFLDKIKNTTLEDTPYTQVEIDTLEKLITEITTWRNKQVEEQDKLARNVDPVLTVQTISVKHSSIEREMRYLMSKFTSWKPKKKEEPKVKAPTPQTDKENDKIPDEQGSDNIVDTNAQDGEVEKPNLDEPSISLEDNVNSESDIKTEESKSIENPTIEPTNTGDEQYDNKHSEL
jgi:hypoxia up-regulated 1